LRANLEEVSSLGDQSARSGDETPRQLRRRCRRAGSARPSSGGKGGRRVRIGDPYISRSVLKQH
jgi:hypothetical protein